MNKYTEIPKEYTEEYDKWFSLETIRYNYDGNIFKACEDHPVYFAYFMLGYKLRYYQIYMINELLNNRFVQGIWGRRLGKTLTFKIYCAWAIWFNKFPSGIFKTTQIIVIGQTGDTAEDYIEDIANMFLAGDERMNLLFKGKYGKLYFSSKFPKKTDKAKNNSTTLSVYNNGWNKIRAFSPTTKIRGKGASVMILDELAFWDDTVADAEEVYSAVVRPVITDNDYTKCFVATTPNGAVGLSYNLMDIDEHKTRYRLIWFPFHVRNDIGYLNEMEKTRQEYLDQGKEMEFAQEYLAEITTKSDAYFTDKEITQVSDDINLMSSYNGDCDMGIDFGGSKNSHTVITISRLNNNIIERIYDKRYPVAQDSTLKDDIRLLLKRFPNIQKFHIDDQGGGSSFYAGFRKEYGQSKIDEVSFKKSKVDMYKQFKIACFQGRVKSYYDKVLFDEFRSFGTAMKPLFKDATDDCLDSFVMSCKDWLQPQEFNKIQVITLRGANKNGRNKRPFVK